MNNILKITCMIALIMACIYALWAQESFQTLDKISVDRNTIVVRTSAKPNYHTFKITNPPRVVIEFSNTEFNAREKEIKGSGTIKRVRGGQFQNDPTKIARVVIDLASMIDFEVKSGDKQVKLILKSENDDNEDDQPENVKIPVVNKVPSVPAQEIAHHKQEKSKPQQSPQASSTTIKEQQKTEDVPITIAQPVPDKEAHKIDIAAQKSTSQTEKQQSMEAPKQAVAPSIDEDKSINKIGATKQNKSSGNKLVIMTKKPITIDFEDADIRDVFKMLSLKSGINIIYGNDVSGNITLRLENVPFDKAFETILALKNLVSHEQGPNILRIATPQQISEERAQSVAFTKIFPLNYAKADDVKGNLDSVRNAEGRKGSISVDERTNSLIITDTPDGLVSFEMLIKELDLKPSQVIIEAKIVEVDLTNDFDLGIQWQYANTSANQSGNQVNIGATQTDANGNLTPVSVANGGTGVSFPATAVSGEVGQIAFGIVSNQTRITGILSALAQKNLSKLLSDPKVTTLNNKEAKILVGQRIPYTTTTVTTAGSTQSTNFLDVGVKLTVTPTINVDHKITLVVHPEVSLFVRTDAAGPVIGTREATTTVIVNDGETVVIGGLITDQDMKQGEQVPLLGDLPIIGHLFKHDYKSKARTELLVFLTPQIVGY